MLSIFFKKLSGNGHMDFITRLSEAVQLNSLVTFTQYKPGVFTVIAFDVVVSCQRYCVNDPGLIMDCVPAHRFLSGPSMGNGLGFTVNWVVTTESQPVEVAKVSLYVPE